jgi:hypothetical protein
VSTAVEDGPVGLWRFRSLTMSSRPLRSRLMFVYADEPTAENTLTGNLVLKHVSNGEQSPKNRSINLLLGPRRVVNLFHAVFDDHLDYQNALLPAQIAPSVPLPL